MKKVLALAFTAPLLLIGAALPDDRAGLRFRTGAGGSRAGPLPALPPGTGRRSLHPALRARRTRLLCAVAARQWCNRTRDPGGHGRTGRASRHTAASAGERRELRQSDGPERGSARDVIEGLRSALLLDVPPQFFRCPGGPPPGHFPWPGLILAAVPFVEPHQLVIVAIRRIFGMELGGERLAAGQPPFRGRGEIARGERREVGRIEARCGRRPGWSR